MNHPHLLSLNDHTSTQKVNGVSSGYTISAPPTAPPAPIALPNARQLDFMELELTQFMHFGIPTFWNPPEECVALRPKRLPRTPHPTRAHPALSPATYTVTCWLTLICYIHVALTSHHHYKHTPSPAHLPISLHSCPVPLLSPRLAPTCRTRSDERAQPKRDHFNPA